MKSLRSYNEAHHYWVFNWRSALGAISLTGLIFASSEVSAEENASTAVFDRAWSHSKLYENPEGMVKLFALSGRLQFDSAWFYADEDNVAPGAEDHFNDMLWRRFRFGFKGAFAGGFGWALEAEINLNNELSDVYDRLTDAYVGWSPGDPFELKLLKQSAGFTLDGATSSKKLLTLQRNNVTNNLWFTQEYFSGVHASGTVNNRIVYRAGLFNGSNADEISFDNVGYFTLLSLGYDFDESLDMKQALIRIDYVYNNKDADDAEALEDNGTGNFDNVVTLATEWEGRRWGLRTGLTGGQGFDTQSDLWGLALMPYYSFTKHHQAIFRYTYMSSSDDNGIRFGRYERELTSGRGDRYNEVYLGYNLFFYGHKLKWQTGLQYTTMDDAANDGGEYEGWGLTTGMRMYWY